MNNYLQKNRFTDFNVFQYVKYILKIYCLYILNNFFIYVIAVQF